MNRTHLVSATTIAIALCWLQPGTLCAQNEDAKDQSFSLSVTPGKYVSVTGDANKFRAHHWMDTGYSGGIRHISFSKITGSDTFFEFEGYTFLDDNDNSAELTIKKDDVGSAELKYKSFRKFFDDSGGFYEPFGTLDNMDLNKNLELDVENLSFALSPAIGDLGGITLLFERHVKNGEKSRLNWAEAREGAVARETTPTWQAIDEAVNIFALQGNTMISGFDVSAEQRYENMDIHNRRYEAWRSTNAVAAQKKKRIQDQKPESHVLTTTFEGKKWFDDDTAYVGLAYRYENINNEELENLTETDEFDVPHNYTSPKTRINATADNDVDDHAIIGHFMKLVTPAFKLTAKAKNQYLKRKSESTYPYDNTAVPDGVIDAIDYSTSKNKALIFGQDFGFQYTGIAKTSLYGDIELTEIDNDMKERQENMARVFQWERVSTTNTTKAVYTLGTRIIPANFFNVTIQGRHRFEDNDYEDDVDTIGAINSAFVDSLKIIGDEFTTKLTWKPIRWLTNALRYQFDRKNYETRVQALDSTPTGRYKSHTITYDIFLQPIQDILFNFSYSIQDAKISTPAAASSAAEALPGFNADVQSVLFTASYTPNEELSLMAALGMSSSGNFNDYTSVALPLGVSNDYYNTEVSLAFKPKNKDWSIEPHYAYYHYDTSSVAEFGNYIAHVAWLDVNLDW